MADRNLILQLLITAKDQASAALQGVRTSVASVGEAASRVLEPLRTFGGLLAAAAGIGGAKELLARADAYARVSNSLKIATSGEQEYQAALKDVAAIAGRTNADIETTAQLYGKVAQSAKELGLSQQQVGQLTEVISKGMQLSGASAETASGAILQLTQAFGSGALRGEEFNSVMEASPELMRQLAAGLGVTIGELRGLAEQGALTSRAVSAALLSQKDAIDKAYGETTRTVGQAFTNLNNQLILYVGKLNESTGATKTIGATLGLLADNLNVVAAAAGAGLVAALGKSTQALVGYVRESLAARAAARDHAIAAAAQRDAALAAAQGNVAAAQGAVNRAIAEQRLAAVLLEEAMGEEAVTRARAAGAAAAAAATAATNRYIAAQAALNAAQATTTAGAGLLSRAMGFLAGPGGLILLAVSAFGALLPLLSKSKTDLDALTVSTDQYKTSLQGLNEAQLLANMQQINAGIQEQADVVRDAEAQVNRLRDGHRNLWEVMRDGRPVAVQLTEAEGKLADARQKLTQLQQNLQAATEALGVARRQESGDLGQQLVQYAKTKLAMEAYLKDLDALGKQQKAVATANEQRIQTELDLAKASGDLQAVERLSVELALAKADAARQQAALDQAAAVAARLKLEAVQKEYDLQRQKTPVDEDALRLARQDVELKNAQAGASAATAAALERQARQTGLLNTAQLGQLSAQERILVAARDEAQASAALAREKGYEYQARQDLVRVAEIEARLAQLNAEKKIIELEAATSALKLVQEEVQAKQALGEAISEVDSARLQAATNAMNAAAIEAEAAGHVAEAEERKAAAIRLGGLIGKDSGTQIQQYGETQQRVAGFVDQASLAAEKNAEANKAAAEAAEENRKKQEHLAAKGAFISNIINGWTERLDALSPAARKAFDGFSKAVDGAELDSDRINAKLEENNQQIAKLAKNLTSVAGGLDPLYAGIATWATKLGQRALEVEQAFYSQQIVVEKAREVLDEYAKTGEYTANVQQAMVMAGGDLENRFELLDEQSLDNLRSALDSANDKLRRMQEETQTARERLAELNAELLEAKGEDQKAEILRQQLDYQQQLAEIEAQRQQAANAGNRDLVAILDEQRQVLEQINTAKLASIKNTRDDEDAAKRSADSANALKGAWSGAADEIERAHRATAAVGAADLSRLGSQLTSLGTAARGLAGAL